MKLPSLKKTRKQEDSQKSEFQVPPGDEEFNNLMERSGVKKLAPENNKKSEFVKIETSEEIIEFVDFHGNLEFQASSIANKFPDEPKRKKTTPFKKQKRLKRGFTPDLELDLHGYKQHEALLKIEQNMNYCLKKQLDTFLIITGKGWNSGQEGGILRKMAWNWLKNDQKGHHYTFKWAPGFLGGKGAIIVFFN